MKINLWRYLSIVSLLLIGALSLTSCVGSSTTASEYYLFRFDTSTSALTMALPSAADIVANLQSPYVGEVIDVAVAADGANSVTLIAGTNVTIKTSASVVPENTTATMYCELDNITSGTEAVTLY